MEKDGGGVELARQYLGVSSAPASSHALDEEWKPRVWEATVLARLHSYYWIEPRCLIPWSWPHYRP